MQTSPGRLVIGRLGPQDKAVQTLLGPVGKLLSRLATEKSKLWQASQGRSPCCRLAAEAAEAPRQAAAEATADTIAARTRQQRVCVSLVVLTSTTTLPWEDNHETSERLQLLVKCSSGTQKNLYPNAQEEQALVTFQRFRAHFAAPQPIFQSWHHSPPAGEQDEVLAEGQAGPNGSSCRTECRPQGPYKVFQKLS